jgi:hypothetical protein
MGAIGIGLVCGWLAAFFWPNSRRSLWSFAAVIISILIVGVEVLLLAGYWGLLAFLLSTSIATLVHAAWRHALYLRAGPVGLDEHQSMQ